MIGVGWFEAPECPTRTRRMDKVGRFHTCARSIISCENSPARPGTSGRSIVCEVRWPLRLRGPATLV